MRNDLGLVALGAYWCLIEILYEQNGIIKYKDLKTISLTISCDVSLLEKIVNDYDLFVINGEKICNNGINKRLKVRQEKSEKASYSAKARWNKYDKNESNTKVDAISITDSNATSNADSNAIYNKKNKKNKKDTTNNLFSIHDQLLLDELWITNTCYSLGIDKNRIDDLIKKFNVHLFSIKKEHKKINEYASHFINWCRASKNDNNQNKLGQISSSTPVN